MLLNLFYCIFFCLINFLIYIRLEKSIHFHNENIVYFVVAFAAALHLDLLSFNHLMNSKDFFNILIFSFGLIVIHYMANLMIAYIKWRDKGAHNHEEIEDGLWFFNFIRQNIMYIMTCLYQILAVCNKSFR